MGDQLRAQLAGAWVRLFAVATALAAVMVLPKPAPLTGSCPPDSDVAVSGSA